MDRVFESPISRRSALKLGAAGLLASQMELLEQLAWKPQRIAMAANPPNEIQFDIGAFIPPAFSVNGVPVRFATVFTVFQPVRLSRNPDGIDEQILTGALHTIEDFYDFSPSGIFMFVGYGVPYFNRLFGGINGSFVRGFMPKLLSDPSRLALEEAVPTTTDVSPQNPGIVKQRFNVPVVIESNDMLFTFRSDSTANILDVINWLQGSNTLKGQSVASPGTQFPQFRGLLQFQRARVMFQQIGLPRKVADANNLPFAGRINPQSPMFMGFADQQVDASGPPAIVTCAGNSSARFTDAQPGDYFGLGSIQHLSHDIQDLAQFYALPSEAPPDGEPFTERVQYMFRSNQLGTVHGIPSEGNADQFTDGGGPAFLDNVFQGTNDAALSARDADGLFAPPPQGRQTQSATFTGAPRIGHISALQRSGRAADGTPVHIRMDGTGFDNMDVPGGSNQPKLQFTVFVPTADFFRRMRDNAAAQDLQAQFNVDPDDNGLERFITATRRQNFLVPPRSRRSFPLTEFPH